MIQTLWNEGGPSGLGYSEIEAYLRCPKEYQYGKVRGILPWTDSMPDYFAVGSFLHAGRARWFAQQFKQDDATWQMMRDDITKVRSEFTLPCSDLAEKQALVYLQEYVAHWSVRPLPSIVAVEHMLGPTNLEEADPATVRTARLDDFGFYPEAGGRLAIGECKTTSAAISDVANQYALHGQPVLQRLLWDAAPQGEAMHGPVAGMILDVIQKGTGGKRCQFARMFIPVNERVLDWGQDTLVAALVAKSYMTAESEPIRRITSCTRLIGRARVACPYLPLCEHGKAGASGFVTEDGKPLDQWQPSADQPIPPWE